MALRDVAAAVTRDTDKPVRQQLERLLASATFKQVDRLKRFLSFIVLESIGGRSTELKEYVIGVHVFGKEPSFRSENRSDRPGAGAPAARQTGSLLPGRGRQR
jgi:hypothetical protein